MSYNKLWTVLSYEARRLRTVLEFTSISKASAANLFTKEDSVLSLRWRQKVPQTILKNLSSIPHLRSVKSPVCHEDGNSGFLRNVGGFLRDCTVQNWKLNSSILLEIFSFTVWRHTFLLKFNLSEGAASSVFREQVQKNKRQYYVLLKLWKGRED